MRRRHPEVDKDRGGDVAFLQPTATPRAVGRLLSHAVSMTTHELYRNRTRFVDPRSGLAEPQEMP